jgi:DNA-binding response OmpR family regulator
VRTLGMSSREGARILFLEDEVLISVATTDILERLGYEVAAVLHLEQAWEAAREELPDAAVLDVNLGKETSFELADWLEARGVPVIFLTGYSYPSHRGRWRDHLRCRKPCNPDEVAALLRKAISGRGRGGGPRGTKFEECR